MVTGKRSDAASAAMPSGRENRGRRARDASQVLDRGCDCGRLWPPRVADLIVEDWIEVVFGVDPDAHSGTAEWLIVVLLGAGVIVSALLAGYEWRRTSTFASEA
jgi:hypothetical protein